MSKLDVAIVGGGPAGLSAALTLGRARKQVIVIDEGRPRNAVTREAHGFLTRDGIPPGELRRIAQEEIGAYPSVQLTEDTVVSIAGEDGDFRLETERGRKLAARKLLFAVGLKDRPLGIPGLAEVYGKSAFVCPYCDGWELRDQPLAVISSGAALMHFAPLLSGWTRRFVVCTNGPDELGESQREDLRRHGIPLYDTPIRRIDSSDGRVRQIVLEDGTALPCTGIFFKPELVPGSGLPQALGCAVSDMGGVAVDEMGRSGVAGIYAAGDGAAKTPQAIVAAASGTMCAAAINIELNQEAWQRDWQ
ncbi:NAD(P)/FAD-dependent oxidoreductase [Cohnella sp. 56]|uniref:NAD(P)/FAD-dependent oxidoreductase n=1 Tax=Cohnella sp. 56 TaxID=3113722 RepID=UPI0030E92A7E